MRTVMMEVSDVRVTSAIKDEQAGLCWSIVGARDPKKRGVPRRNSLVRRMPVAQSGRTPVQAWSFSVVDQRMDEY